MQAILFQLYPGSPMLSIAQRERNTWPELGKAISFEA
jgi:hypothetical protein